jgi:CheY-like chemotaxis protein
LASAPPDLILTDFMMPGMNGHEMLRTVRANRRFRNVPLILVSAVPDAARRNSPADGFLAKPLDLEETAKTLHRWIARQAQAPRRPRK